MIKAVFFDIDGTLVSFKTHRIPESTIKALYLLKKRGVKIFIASGRSPYYLRHLDKLPFDGYVTFNGSYCYTPGNKVIYKSPVPQQNLDQVVAYSNAFNHPFSCSFMTVEGTFINYIGNAVRDMAELVNLPLPTLLPLEEAAMKEVYQIGLYVNREDEQHFIKELFNNCVSNRWHEEFTDINNKGNTKDAGINQMIEHFGIDLSEVMAFGDGGNDICMLSHVPYGVAMGNASDDVRSAARYVTDTVDENGIWNALVRFNVLKEDKLANSIN